MNSEITLLAVARKGGFLEASGFSGPAAAACCNRSRAASQPMPKPDFCRNSRRELLIDIDELAHIEDQQTQAGQRIAAQIVPRSPAFLRGRRAAECQAPSRF